MTVLAGLLVAFQAPDVVIGLRLDSLIGHRQVVPTGEWSITQDQMSLILGRNVSLVHEWALPLLIVG